MIYEFRCLSCGEKFDHQLPMDAPKEANCPKCGGTGKRLYSLFQISMDSTQEGFDIGLGKFVRTKRDVRDAQKEINFKTGSNIETISIKDLDNKPKPVTKSYDTVTEEACRILSS